MASSPHPHLERLADFITKRRGWILAAVIAALRIGLGLALISHGLISSRRLPWRLGLAIAGLLILFI